MEFHKISWDQMLSGHKGHTKLLVHYRLGISYPTYLENVQILKCVNTPYWLNIP